MLTSILRAGKLALVWLFNPRPLVEALWRQYRNESLLATALFLASVVVGVIVAPHVPENKLREQSSSTPVTSEERAQAEAKFQSIMESALNGESGGKRFSLTEREFQLMRAPRSPGLAAVWFGILIAMVLDTLITVVLGAFFGLYPAGRIIAAGVIVGTTLTQLPSDNPPLIIFPTWLLIMVSSLVSVAVGFDMARYIVQRNKGAWFKKHIRRGLRTWATAVLPAILVAMLLQGLAFALSP